MKKIAFFDTKPYDVVWFDKLKDSYNVQIKYYESKLTPDTAVLAKNFDGVIAFVNDVIDKETIDRLYEYGVKFISLRCAGYNNVDLKYAAEKIKIFRVPNYSPYAVSEHTMGMLLCLNRKIHKAYIRTKDLNFTLNGLTGFDLHGKTVGVIGTGKIGRVFMDICRGFGMKILAYDVIRNAENVEYTDLKTLFGLSDIISLHCPLTNDTYHIINKESVALMKDGVYIINTSRGALIDSSDLLDGLKTQKIGGAALDVYEEETEIFFEDKSDEYIHDDNLRILLTMPNVLITSHQAFLTAEALENIASVTLENIREFEQSGKCKNEISK